MQKDIVLGKNFKTASIILALILFIIFVFYISNKVNSTPNAAQTNQPKTAQLGDEGILKNFGNNDPVLVAVSQDANSKFIKTAIAKD